MELKQQINIHTIYAKINLIENIVSVLRIHVKNVFFQNAFVKINS